MDNFVFRLFSWCHEQSRLSLKKYMSLGTFRGNQDIPRNNTPVLLPSASTGVWLHYHQL